MLPNLLTPNPLQMKNSRLLFIALCIFAGLAFTACEEQAEIAPAQIEPLSNEEYLRLSYHPPILFQYTLHDKETDELSGFLIDKSGEIRSFLLDETPYEYKQNHVINVVSQTLERQLEISESTDTYANLDELVEHTQAIRRSGSHEIIQQAGNPEARFTETFYAFGVANRHRHGGCQTGGSPTSTSSSFSQIPLLSEGRLKLESTSTVSANIVNWLKAQKEEQVIDLTSAN